MTAAWIEAAIDRPLDEVAVDHARSVESLCVEHGALISDDAIGWVRAEIFTAVGNERRKRAEDVDHWSGECLAWAKMHAEAVDYNDWLLSRNWWQRLLNVRRCCVTGESYVDRRN